MTMTPDAPPTRTWLRSLIRDVPDYPEPGVMFRDISPLLADPEAFNRVIDEFIETIPEGINLVTGIEARGFLLAVPIAMRLNVGFVPLRKAGKLPGPINGADYGLEYGKARIEMIQDAVHGRDVLVIDDVLATGGSAEAACRLIEEGGGRVVALRFLIELPELGGMDRLRGRDAQSLLALK